MTKYDRETEYIVKRTCDGDPLNQGVSTGEIKDGYGTVGWKNSYQGQECGHYLLVQTDEMNEALLADCKKLLEEQSRLTLAMLKYGTVKLLPPDIFEKMVGKGVDLYGMGYKTFEPGDEGLLG